MRLLGIVLLTFLYAPTTKAQSNLFMVGTGISFGQQHEQCGLRASGLKRAWGIELRTVHELSDSYNLVVGLRYNTFACSTRNTGFLNQNEDSFFESTSFERQFYLAFPIHIHVPVKSVYLIVGSNLGFLMNATSRNTWQDVASIETARHNNTRTFARWNVTLVSGFGINLKPFSQSVYLQLLYSRAVFNTGFINRRPKESGLNKELYLSTGVVL